MSKKAELNSGDHENMHAFLGHVLEDFKASRITKEAAVDALAHVMAALDRDKYDEAREWFRQGRSFLSAGVSPNLQSGSNATEDNEGLWPEHEKRLFNLVTAIWPSTPLNEISRKISLKALQEMVDGGNLASELEVSLKDYLSSLPGYGTPGLEDEAERHHGFLTVHLHRLAAEATQVPSAKDKAD